MNLFSWLYTSDQKWARGVVEVPLIGPQMAEDIISVFPCIVRLFRLFHRIIPAMSDLLRRKFRNVKVLALSVLDCPIWINSFVRPWWASRLDLLRRLVRCWYSFHHWWWHQWYHCSHWYRRFCSFADNIRTYMLKLAIIQLGIYDSLFANRLLSSVNHEHRYHEWQYP